MQDQGKSQEEKCSEREERCTNTIYGVSTLRPAYWGHLQLTWVQVSATQCAAGSQPQRAATTQHSVHGLHCRPCTRTCVHVYMQSTHSPPWIGTNSIIGSGIYIAILSHVHTYTEQS